MDFKFNIEKHPDTELPFDVMYYVENPNNPALNDSMKQLQTRLSRIESEVPELFPMHFEYVSQQELSEETLTEEVRKIPGFLHLADGINTQKVVEETRKAFFADEGGGLFMREAPKTDINGDLEYSDNIFRCTNLPAPDPTSAQKALDSFTDFVARHNFENATGYSYEYYTTQKDTPDFHHSTGIFQMVTTNNLFESLGESQKAKIDEIIATTARRILREMEKEGISDPRIFNDLPEGVMKVFRESAKFPEIYDISIEASDTKDKVFDIVVHKGDKKYICDIGGPLNKSLYIYFLRRRKLSSSNNKKKDIGISVDNLEEELKSGEDSKIYKEILGIYKKFRPEYKDTTGRIKHLCDNIAQMRNEISRGFTDLFQKSIASQYSIDNSQGLYRITLPPRHIDLGAFADI